MQLVRQISACIGYAYDDLDEVALIGAVGDTYDEAVNGWFDPLEGCGPSLAHHRLAGRHSRLCR
ncbi:hypothetical protein ACFYL6_15680 [Micromonospora sp. NPDC007208]|uniref:hypothetical protein n=1 Tax=Micromonospora sp. NPDC007208 TaxID=3364236 RepID=UPI0036A3CDD2